MAKGKGARNRTPEEWKQVLEHFGYKLRDHDGDDEVWKHDKCPNLRVLVPKRNRETIIITTATYMLRVIERCGVATRKDIKKWWEDNGYGR